MRSRWTPGNKVREGRGVGGWMSPVMGMKEGPDCVDHWALYANNDHGTLHQKLRMYSMAS